MVTHAAKSNKFETYERIADVPVITNINTPLAPKVRAFIEEAVKLCRPDDVYICDGSETENAQLLKMLESRGTIQPLPKYDNW